MTSGAIVENLAVARGIRNKPGTVNVASGTKTRADLSIKNIPGVAKLYERILCIAKREV